MATWMQALGACSARVVPEEKRLADRLEQTSKDEYLRWGDMPVGPKQTRLNFVLSDPHRSALMSPTSACRPCTHKSPAARALLRCHRQFTATYWQVLRPQCGGFSHGLVGNVIRAVERRQILGGHDQAVMIEAGNDASPEWLQLVAQMLVPSFHSLLMLYDHTQSRYERTRGKQFSFKSVGIQARERSAIMKINYRNTRQIIHFANLVDADLLTADNEDDDSVSLSNSAKCGRTGQAP